MPYESRMYRYRNAVDGIARESAVAEPALAAGAVYRFFLGRDRYPVELDPPAVTDAPADPYWRIVLAAGKRPVTLAELMRDLGGSFDAPRCFVVGDGGQIPYDAAIEPVQRELRLIVAFARGTAEPDLLVSTAPALDDSKVFLQVIAWDPAAGAYQFYDRRHGAWAWVGSSWEALASDTRGQGPFDSHVNGALNMKELKAPWLHWHSMAAVIGDAVLAPNDPIRSHRLWQERRGGNEFELTIARPGIERWTRQRLAKSLRDGQLANFPQWFRQIVTTTTVNIASSSSESRNLRAGVPVHLPLSFFIDRDALLDLLGIEPDIEVPVVDGGVYRAAVAAAGLHLTDGNHRFEGDAHFAFAVPEPAYEDLQVLRVLLEAGVMTPRLAAAILMVDFTNPVFSERRAGLMRHCPASVAAGDAEGLERHIVRSIGDAPKGSAEAELLDNLQPGEGQWQSAHAHRIEAYAATWRWADTSNFAPIMQLADSRRREFRRRPLAEFKLTLPYSTTPADAPYLELGIDGQVRQKPRKEMS